MSCPPRIDARRRPGVLTDWLAVSGCFVSHPSRRPLAGCRSVAAVPRIRCTVSLWVTSEGQRTAMCNPFGPRCGLARTAVCLRLRPQTTPLFFKAPGASQSAAAAVVSCKVRYLAKGRAPGRLLRTRWRTLPGDPCSGPWLASIRSASRSRRLHPGLFSSLSRTPELS